MRVLVLGGGISGLSAAHYLLKYPKVKVTVVEASNSLGGWMRTVRDSRTNLLFEKGPRTVRPVGPVGRNTLSLIEDLDLDEKVRPIKRNHPSAKNRLIYAKKELHALPSTLASVFRRVPPFSKPLIWALFKDYSTSRKVCSDDSIYSFTERRFGKEIADYAISPMICGICAGDAQKISVKFLMSMFFEAEQKYGSVVKGMWKGNMFNSGKPPQYEGELAARAKSENWSVWSLDGGMRTFVKGLRQSLENQGASIVLNTTVDEINFNDNSVKVKIGNADCTYDHVISSLPAGKSAKILEKSHPTLADELSSIPAVSVAVVNLAYKKRVLKQKAFGFLVPPIEKLPILGVLFDTCSFPQGDWTVLTAMLGGEWFQDHLGQDPSEDRVMEIVLTQLRNILEITDEPISYHVSILKDCIHQYIIGHSDRVQRIFKYIEEKNLPISLVGASYSGVGVNDAIMSSKNAVIKLLDGRNK